MVPDDTSADDESTIDKGPSADDASASPSAGDRYEPNTDRDGFNADRDEFNADRDGPDADSQGFLAPGDDAPADVGDVLLYGLVGGIAGSVLSFVPFATVLGGAVAGYLCGGTSADALKTGTVAGAVMTLPFVAMVAVFLFFFGIAGAPAEFGIFAFLVVGIGAAYTLGSGVIGGYLGHYLRGKL